MKLTSQLFGKSAIGCVGFLFGVKTAKIYSFPFISCARHPSIFTHWLNAFKTAGISDRLRAVSAVLKRLSSSQIFPSIVRTDSVLVVDPVIGPNVCHDRPYNLGHKNVLSTNRCPNVAAVTGSSHYLSCKTPVPPRSHVGTLLPAKHPRFRRIFEYLLKEIWIRVGFSHRSLPEAFGGQEPCGC